jgi:hypothetical protein
MKLFFAVLAVIIAILFAPMFLSPAPDNQTGPAMSGLPWQIEVLADGHSRVFDLTIGVNTLNDVRARFGEGEMALVAAPDETASLELYLDTVTVGAVTGKLIVTAEIPVETIAAMRQRATKTQYMKSSTKKSALAEQDIPAAVAAPIRGLAFMPTINLDEATIIQRFGQPAERIRSSEQTEHLLYPERGLDVTLDSENKELLQYVAPRDFARLREPLKNTGEKQ